MNDFHLPRKCKPIGADSIPDTHNGESVPLKSFREEEAYILLGAPGAGKTTSFKYEAKHTENGIYVTARDLITFEYKPEWRNQTLFIDGLDELSEGFVEQTTIDKIRKILYDLDKPRFRLACRSADWFRKEDLIYFKEVTRSGNVSFLLLSELTDSEIMKFSNSNPSVSNPKNFLQSAIENGIHDILRNPLNLSLFAQLSHPDDLPDNRSELFEQFCTSLLRDNLSPGFHRAVNWSPKQKIELVGKLCAIMLLSGHAGFCRHRENVSENYLFLGDIYDVNPNDIRQVLNTGLFELAGENCFKPIHFQIAEYLAAKFTNSQIKGGLPYTRLLRLISGNDCGIVKSLRGFAAWLASLNTSVRDNIISQNPLATVLYGDVKNFSNDEKNRVLENLSRFNPTDEWILDWHDEKQLGNLVTTDTVKKLQASLESTMEIGVVDSHYSFNLKILKFADLSPEIGQILITIVRRNQIDATARSLALETLTSRKHLNSEELESELWHLLGDVMDEKIADPHDDLYAILLTHFYPNKIPASKILTYLKPRKKRYLIGRYHLFWLSHVCENSTLEQMETILDTLVELKSDPTKNSGSEFQMDELLRLLFTLAVLKIYLEKSNDIPEIAQLHEWMGIASGAGEPNHNPIFGGMQRIWIQEWLERYPEVQLSIIETGVNEYLTSNRPVTSDSFQKYIYLNIERRLFRAQPPSNYGLWCLNQSENTDSDVIAEYFIRCVAEFIYFDRNNEGLSREFVYSKLAGNNRLLKLFDQRLSELSAIDQRENHLLKKGDEELANVKSELSIELNRNREEILRHEGRIDLLYQMAAIYYGRYIEFPGDSPYDRVKQALGSELDLIKIVLESFKNTIKRKDVPSHIEFLRSFSESKSSYHGLPFLAGLDEFDRTERPHKIELNSRQLKQALAFYFAEYPLTNDDLNRLPDWFVKTMISHPETVAEILINFNRSSWKSNADAPKLIYELASDPRFKTVANFATIPLLKAFPIRCPNSQLILLGLLLRAAMLHCDETSLLNLINKKVSRKNIMIAQHGYWLIAGLIVLPNEFLDRVEPYVSKYKSRIRYLTDAMSILIGDSTILSIDSVPVLNLLIGIIGTSYAPPVFVPDDNKDNHQFEGLHSSILAQRLIYRLSSIGTVDASRALKELASNNDLDSWQQHIAIARARQNEFLQESVYKFREANQVRLVLDNLEPVSAGDLAAICVEHINQLGNEIRNNNTSDWRQYWNVNSVNQPQKPKPENGCRDNFASALSVRLQRSNIDVQTEGVHSNGNKSDILISFNNFHIPVEVKLSKSTDLWTACQKQLIEKYTIDPSAGEHGIYLVFWFGIDYLHRTRSMIDVGPPQNALELEKLLHHNLREEKREHISICVIDVSKPQRSS